MLRPPKPLLALVPVLAVVLTGSVGLARPASSAALAAAATPGVQLPNGRLVTPAGSRYDPLRNAATDHSYDLGEYPLGLAISPDGRLAVSSGNGYGTGINAGFNSLCEQNQDGSGGQGQVAACPGVPDYLKRTGTVHTFDEGLDVVDTTTGTRTQATVVPTSYKPDFASQNDHCAGNYNCMGIGVQFSPDGRHVYALGAGTDEVYRFDVAGGALTFQEQVPTAGAAARLSMGSSTPVVGQYSGQPKGLAVTPDGKTVVVANELDNTIEVFAVDATTGALTLTNAGLMPLGAPAFASVAYLYGVATTNTTAYISAQGLSTVFAVPLATVPPLVPGVTAATGVTGVAPAVPVAVGDHPTGIALSKDGSTLAVANANDDTVSILPTDGLGTAAAGLATPLSVAGATTVHVGVVPRGTEVGAAPDAVAFSADGKTLYAALGGDNALAVIDPVAAAVKGYVPTGWYPSAVQVGSDGRIWVTDADGLGARYVKGLDGNQNPPPGATIPTSDYYDVDNIPGLMQVFAPPSAATLAAYTQIAAQDVLHAGGLDTRPATSPIPVAVGGTSPITHVVYVVRENRTFDQVFGDLALTRQDVDAAPQFQLLASATPNAHAVSNQFAIADHFFSDGEASVQGHWWTSSAQSTDYLEKSWRQYYSSRNRPYDPIGTVVNPHGCSIFQKMTAEQPTLTSKNFGELVGAVDINTSLTSAVADPANAATQGQALACNGGAPVDPASNPAQDPQYPTQITLVPDDRTRATRFLTDSGLNADGSPANNGNSLANFNYLILSEDHTSGFANSTSTGNTDGDKTPRAQVATNDQALGMIISGLSHSADWSSTAVFVVEDDSQDGFDHVDGHRNVLLVASPYTKHVSGDGCLPGYIGHAHYDQASVLKTMELILGLSPLSSFDAGASPLYDLFGTQTAASQLTPDDLKPFDLQAAPAFARETVTSVTGGSTTPAGSTSGSSASASPALLTALSKNLDLTHIDASEAALENILWLSVRDDAPPAQLAGALAAAQAGGSPDSEAQQEAGLGATSTALADIAAGPVEVRPGTPPALSTVTGKPFTGAATCAAPVTVTTPVQPGQTTLPGRASAGGGSLASTGLPLGLAGLAGAFLAAGTVVRRRRRA